jgi:hypothetical protein
MMSALENHELDARSPADFGRFETWLEFSFAPD